MRKIPPRFSSKERLKRIGENLLIYREAAGKAISSVAQSLGVDDGFIEKVEHGKAELTFIQYVAVSELYGVGFSAIFEARSDVYFISPQVPKSLVDYIVERLSDYCHKNDMQRKRLYEILETLPSTISNFRRYKNTPMPPTVENIIGLLGLKSDDLKKVMSGSEPEEKQKDIGMDGDEPNNVMDAMTLVSDALAYYKNKEKHVKALRKIVTDIQEILVEMGDEV